MSRLIHAKQPLAVADFTWENQGSCTATDASGAIKMYGPSNGSAEGIRYLWSGRSGNYTFTTHMNIYNYAGGLRLSGIMLDTIGGKKIVFGYYHSAVIPSTTSTDRLYLMLYDSNTSLNTTWNSYSNAFWDISNIWLKIEDIRAISGGANGTRKYYSSADGINWTLHYTQSNYTFVTYTATKVGIGINPYAGAEYVEFDSAEFKTL